MRKQDMVVAWASVVMGICCLIIAATGLSDFGILPQSVRNGILTWGPLICLAWLGVVAVSAAPLDREGRIVMSGLDTCPSCSERVPSGSRFCQACGSEMKEKRPRSNVKQAGQRPRSLPQSYLFAAGALIIVLLTGLAIGGMTWARSREQHVAKAQQPAQAPLAIAEAGPVPAWLASADKALIADYAWAAEHHDELQYFPCFCGCYDSVGHVSNSECYYKRGGDQRILAYDQHAYG